MVWKKTGFGCICTGCCWIWHGGLARAAKRNRKAAAGSGWGEGCGPASAKRAGQRATERCDGCRNEVTAKRAHHCGEYVGRGKNAMSSTTTWDLPCRLPDRARIGGKGEPPSLFCRRPTRASRRAAAKPTRPPPASGGERRKGGLYCRVSAANSTEAAGRARARAGRRLTLPPRPGGWGDAKQRSGIRQPEGRRRAARRRAPRRQRRRLRGAEPSGRAAKAAVLCPPRKVSPPAGFLSEGGTPGRGGAGGETWRGETALPGPPAALNTSAGALLWGHAAKGAACGDRAGAICASQKS